MLEIQSPLEKAKVLLKTIPEDHKRYDELLNKWESELASKPAVVSLIEPLDKLRNVAFLIRKDCVDDFFASEERSYELEMAIQSGLQLHTSDADHMKTIREVTQKAEGAFDNVATDFDARLTSVETSLAAAGNQAAHMKDLQDKITALIPQLETQTAGQQHLDQADNVEKLKDAEVDALKLRDAANKEAESLGRLLPSLDPTKGGMIFMGFHPGGADAVMALKHAQYNSTKAELERQEKLAADQDVLYNKAKKNRENAEAVRAEYQTAIADLKATKSQLDGYVDKNSKYWTNATTEQTKLVHEKKRFVKVHDHMGSLHGVIHSLDHLKLVPTRIEVANIIVSIINHLTPFQRYTGVTEKLKMILDDVDSTCNWVAEEEDGKTAHKNLLSVRDLVENVEAALKENREIPQPLDLNPENYLNDQLLSIKAKAS